MSRIRYAFAIETETTGLFTCVEEEIVHKSLLSPSALESLNS